MFIPDQYPFCFRNQIVYGGQKRLKSSLDPLDVLGGHLPRKYLTVKLLRQAVHGLTELVLFPSADCPHVG